MISEKEFLLKELLLTCEDNNVRHLMSEKGNIDKKIEVLKKLKSGMKPKEIGKDYREVLDKEKEIWDT